MRLHGSQALLFGHGFEAGWTALTLLAFANFVASATDPSGLVLTMTGHQDTSAWVFSGAISNIVLVIVARRKLGLRTALIG